MPFPEFSCSVSSDETYPPATKRRRIEHNDSSDTASSIAKVDRLTNNLPWRDIMCSLANIRPDVEDARLLQEVADMSTMLQDIAESQKTRPPTFAILHRVYCSRQEDSATQELDIEPPWSTNESHLRSLDRVTDLDGYIQSNETLSFIVIREYFCCPWKARTLGVVPEHQSETLVILSDSLLRTLSQVQSSHKDHVISYVKLQTNVEIMRPHVWTYYSLTLMKEALVRLKSRSAEDAVHLQLFLEYFRDGNKSMHAELESLLSRKLISAKFIDYLFIPGTTLIHSDTRGPAFDTASKQTAWASIHTQWTTDASKKGGNVLDRQLCDVIIEMNTTCWSFNGDFWQDSGEEKVAKRFYKDDPLDISSFSCRPLQYAEADRTNSLRTRGQVFWRCRKKQYVEYTGLDDHGAIHPYGTRFMIDGEARRDFTTRTSNPEDREKPKIRLPAATFARDVPPPGDFLLLLPRYIEAFHMEEKRWMWLLVSNISDVIWNQNVFDTLVLPDDTKELIKALVMNKIATDERTDYFRGKGSGLVILFHGPPGTGKTLTAESVAELARKPLYRVACGDIGTRPDDVERQLKRSLWLAEQWDSVVLLDEAEVFLQERTLDNVERNALVSIFLRTLEYYNGILILTTNRVGTFDEGFRSRIQLAIHYEALSPSSREQVWENFIKRLEGFRSEDIDISDLRDHLKELGEYKMNGRQIRNVVTTARQLAMFKKEPLDFNRMKHVIKVTGQFDKYLLKVNEGMDSEALAREDGLR
ncbi:hypothetical protein BDV96DRAFT_580284 [Lophiotrema nucula]|uniref:AAA+ ATPase domain-containing protein n=1 Tax=Lophiotrema nucula TaxID=690887 RepID=A0A6A5YZX2_9PLEO|nr:hypothetical protein BDV96DRAFT_580284 [Lophiotrema nucula]